MYWLTDCDTANASSLRIIDLEEGTLLGAFQDHLLAGGHAIAHDLEEACGGLRGSLCTSCGCRLLVGERKATIGTVLYSWM